MENNGFVIVASNHFGYYQAAKDLIDSLIDMYPDARIALFAHKEWVKGDRSDTIEKVEYIYDCPVHKRSKLWALSRTPYDITCYLDADSYVVHEDVTKMLEIPDDKDILFTNVREYAAATIEIIDNGEADGMSLHGGVFTYRKTEETMSFMRDWFDYYYLQNRGEWWPEGVEDPERLRPWDQTTLWWLIKYPYRDTIRVGIFENDARFNFVYVYREEELNGEPKVIFHYTLPLDDDPSSYLKREKDLDLNSVAVEITP